VFTTLWTRLGLNNMRLKDKGVISVEKPSTRGRVVHLIGLGLRTAPPPMPKKEIKAPGEARKSVSRSTLPTVVSFRSIPSYRPSTCQFIDGQPSPSDDCKCGRAVVPGKPYCLKHCASCYQPGGQEA